MDPRWTGKDGDAYAQTLTAGLGDWLPPQGVPTINALVSSAFHAHLAHIAADTARALGDTAGAARYEARFAAVRADFNARFLSPEGIYREKAEDGFVQTAQVLPLAFGLVPDGQRAAVAQKLAADITTRRGGHAYVGVIGAAYVLPVLTATGHHDVAFTVATRPTSRAGLLDRHAEFTGSVRAAGRHALAPPPLLRRDRPVVLRGSRRHPALEPGYATIDVAPQVPSRGLDRVAATTRACAARCDRRDQRADGAIEYRVSIPPTRTAGCGCRRRRVRDPGNQGDGAGRACRWRPRPE